MAYAFSLSRTVPTLAPGLKIIFNQIAKKGLLAHTKQRILMKYEKPKPNTALRRSRRGINPSPANPHAYRHRYVDAYPALRAH
jgi:hypothetical protein